MQAMRGSKLFAPGTLACTLLCTALGLLTAILLLWAGIWKTLLVAFVIAVAVFIGGVRDKRAFVRRILQAFRRGESPGA